jgi:hypothetical protein
MSCTPKLFITQTASPQGVLLPALVQGMGAPMITTITIAAT